MRLKTSGRVGDLPLLSPTSGRPDYGLIIKPRFGWQGIGSMLGAMGWKILPEPLPLPLLPRSDRKVPPWVLSTTILLCLQRLFKQLEPRFELTSADLRAPRGQVNWNHRQWVFSIPKRLRIYFMYDRRLPAKLSQCAWKVLSLYLQQGVPFEGAASGAVVAVQTFGDFLNFKPHLRTAEMSLEGNYNMVDGILNNGAEQTSDERKKESISQRIEQYKAEAEQNGAPVDGHEPPERTLQEKERPVIKPAGRFSHYRRCWSFHVAIGWFRTRSSVSPSKSTSGLYAPPPS